MKPIAIFYHCLVYKGSPPILLPEAVGIIQEFACYLKDSGLADVVSEIVVGVNGGEESVPLVRATMPESSKLVLHGLNSFAENLTLIELEKWVPSHPGWNVFYGHSKGATHVPMSDYANMVARWRRCMLQNCLCNWRQCVHDLENGFEAVGCHWLTGQGWDRSQHYFGGNMWWAQSDFLSTIPSMFTRERIKQSGIASLESRFEAEVHIGNGPRIPITKDYAKHGIMQCP